MTGAVEIRQEFDDRKILINVQTSLFTLREICDRFRHAVMLRRRRRAAARSTGHALKQRLDLIHGPGERELLLQVPLCSPDQALSQLLVFQQPAQCGAESGRVGRRSQQAGLAVDDCLARSSRGGGDYSGPGAGCTRG